MGGNYSRIQGNEFPSNYFALGFRQPDVIQFVNAPPEILTLLRQVIQNKWSSGIRSEKKLGPMGFEIRLSHEPFSTDVGTVDKIMSCYKLCCIILEELMNHGCVLVTNGHLIRGIERNLWILRQDNKGTPTSQFHSISLIGLEDWGRILLVNFSSDVFEMVKQNIESTWCIGINRSSFFNECGVFELAGQPWDSYKAESDKTPLLLKRLIETVSQKGFGLLCCTHIRGVIDSLFFLRTFDFQNDNLLLMSLNQQDQLRFYGVTSEVSQAIGKFVRDKWDKGLVSDEMVGSVWTLRLKGTPWWVPEWDKDSACAARELITQILQKLWILGWDVVDTAEIYRGQYDKSVFILSQQSETLPRGPQIPRTYYFCISSHDGDGLSVIGSPADTQTFLKDVIQCHWSLPHKCENESASSGNLEFILHGKPWQFECNDSNSNTNMEGIGLLCWILERLLGNGYRLICSADVTSSTKYSPHTWFLSYTEENHSTTSDNEIS